MLDMKEKLVELLTDCEAKGFWSYGTDCKTGEHGGHEMTAEDIADYLAENIVSKWISVKDRLPEYGQPVLVCDAREDYVGKAVLQPAKRFVFSKSKDYWDWDRMECQIDEFTHWMPLPKPPKEG